MNTRQSAITGWKDRPMAIWAMPMDVIDRGSMNAAMARNAPWSTMERHGKKNMKALHRKKHWQKHHGPPWKFLASMEARGIPRTCLLSSYASLDRHAANSHQPSCGQALRGCRHAAMAASIILDRHSWTWAAMDTSSSAARPTKTLNLFNCAIS